MIEARMEILFITCSKGTFFCETFISEYMYVHVGKSQSKNILLTLEYNRKFLKITSL